MVLKICSSNIFLFKMVINYHPHSNFNDQLYMSLQINSTNCKCRLESNISLLNTNIYKCTYICI